MPGFKTTACTLVLLLVALSETFSQGCSDAGFCTMGAMKPDQPFSKKISMRLRSMELSFYHATTITTVRISSITADLNFGLNDKYSLQVKIPYLIANGRFAQTSGLSDISLCMTRNVYSHEKFDVNVSLGAKIPTNDSDKWNDGRPLPMYYQTSLGSYDGILGISLVSRNWLLATGIQHPFTKNNNQFVWKEEWLEFTDRGYLRLYSEAAELKRGTDVMLRVERNFRFSRFNFSLGMLPIYRISNDEILDRVTNTRYKVGNAHGLALSALFTAGYRFNVRSGIKLLLGKKITNRDVNPDGLSREAVSTFSYYYRF